jgi:hypothetical protein
MSGVLLGWSIFYQDIYPKQAQTLAQLSDLRGHKRKFVWTEIHEKAFQQMKHIMSQDTLLTYPQFDQPFVIHTDASDNQIGGVDMQNNKLLGFFSKKLTKTQCKYPVTEQELLAFVETLKYFKHMLLGLAIIVQTDHKNLTHPTSTHTLDWVLHQRLLLEEYGVDIQYIKGEKNVIADALSHLPTQELFQFEQDDDAFPLNLTAISSSQLSDGLLQSTLVKHPEKYSRTVREGVSLYVDADTDAIYVPPPHQLDILNWYHTTLQHPGIKRMQATLHKHFYLPGMDTAVAELVSTCATCQTGKITAVKKYGKTPLPTNTKIATWEQVHVDLIGPWDIRYNSTKTPGRSTVEKIHALTIIYKTTGWPEFVAIQNKTSCHIALLFNSEWLCCCPRPERVVFDNGNEFTGSEFQELLSSYEIKPVPTMVRNPKSNGIIEQVHLTMVTCYAP